jgi:twinkle protein
LYDISGSAHFRNKADNGLIVARDFANPDNPYVDIHTAKIRFRGIGKIGMCQLKYDKVTGGYSDAQPPPVPVDPPDDNPSFFWEN